MKKLFLLTSLFVVFGLTLTAYAQQIQSGSFSANADKARYTLHENSGDRSYTIEVEFKKPFNSKPTVILSTSLLDAAKDKGIRYNIGASAVSRDGFIIKISTWADTHIYGIGGYWIAHTTDSDIK